MQDWFKHDKGYVNIDDTNIYFTTTGNWSEAKKLTERTPKAKFWDDMRRFRIYLFLAVAAASVIIMFIRKFHAYKLTYAGLVLLPFGAYQLYKYLKQDMGSSFMIPLSKIKSIEWDKNDATIRFTNGVESHDVVVLYKVEEKGEKILKAIPKIEG